ncbi:hypothetical protein N7G274_005809 [Stereocaulon virgatum]|uniref:Protein kinase domain-containing protein n=1 Tax=Stereocaulon virgatum TaxID=373712 RepID=A0ABR4A688_9LECA
MEYFPLGDLDSRMTEDFSDSSVKEISTQILHGLKAMHAEGFAHRDLKPANIFVVQQIPSWWIKLGDSGISKRTDNTQTALRTMVGTNDYMAPEFFGYVDECDEESSAYTNAVDLWAVGCIIYKLYTHEVPFSAKENLQPLKLYCWGKRSFPEDLLRARKVKSVMVGFISRLLESVPWNRLTAEAALENPWLNSVVDQAPEWE